MISRDMSEAISPERVHNKSDAECSSVAEDRALIDLQAQEHDDVTTTYDMCECVGTVLLFLIISSSRGTLSQLLD